MRRGLRSGRMVATALGLAVLSMPAGAETLRLATYDAGLSRSGPGLLYGDILKGNDPQIAAALAVITALDADVLVLTGFDFDLDLVALTAFNARLGDAGRPYSELFALRPNTGNDTGFDVDGNGKLAEPRDAQGWGRFSGEAGIAVLSRLPIDRDGVVDFSGFLWRDLPGATLPDTVTPELAGVLRLSHTAHWQVPLVLPGGGRLTLLTFDATPPVFDGPEDRNGRRNHDEAVFWLRLLEGALPWPAPVGPVALIGTPNLDPVDGEGLPAALTGLMRHPAFQAVSPRGDHGRQEPAHSGDPSLDTALYDEPIGGLRVDMILPPAGWTVEGAGVLWPGPQDPLAAQLALASNHRPVWVDLTLP